MLFAQKTLAVPFVQKVIKEPFNTSLAHRQIVKKAYSAPSIHLG